MTNGEIKRLPVIEIHRCYMYDCDSCGSENLIRPIVRHDSVTMIPMAVLCWFCGAKYRTPNRSEPDILKGCDGHDTSDSGLDWSGGSGSISR